METDEGLALVAAAIAAGATLLGTLLGSMLQAWLAKRQRAWAVQDRDAARAHELALRHSDTGEDRFQRLRAERRDTYGRLLDGVHDHISALRDVRDAGLPDGVNVSSVHELENLHPIAARALRAMERQRRLEAEVVLIADGEVRDSVLALSQALREAFRDAIKQEDGLGPVYAQYDVVLGAMRRELVGPPRRMPAASSSSV